MKVDWLRSYVRCLVTTTDTVLTPVRTKIGIGAMDSTQVTLVTDQTICSKAVTSMSSALQTPDVGRAV